MNFVSGLTKEFEVSPEKTQVSMVQFAHKVRHVFCFNDFTTDTDLAAALTDRARYLTGSTKTTSALKYPNRKLFTTSCGARPDSSRVVVLVTDGMANNMVTSQQEVDKLEKSGVKVISVGVGASISDAKRQVLETVQ